MNDIIYLILTLLGSGIVVAVGGYKISIGVQKALDPVVAQVNLNTSTLNQVQGAVQVLQTVTPPVAAPATDVDVNTTGTGNVYNERGELVFEHAGNVVGCTDTVPSL